MDYYAASVGGVIAPKDMETFSKIRAILDSMPNLDFGPRGPEWGSCMNQVSCHLICRALAEFFEVSFQDGYFDGHFRHSWLIPKSKTSIIDAYPVAGAAPFIVSRAWPSPWLGFYKDSSGEELKHLFNTEVFREQLKQTLQAVHETIKQLGFVA